MPEVALLGPKRISDGLVEECRLKTQGRAQGIDMVARRNAPARLEEGEQRWGHLNPASQGCLGLPSELSGQAKLVPLKLTS